MFLRKSPDAPPRMAGAPVPPSLLGAACGLPRPQKALPQVPPGSPAFYLHVGTLPGRLGTLLAGTSRCRSDSGRMLTRLRSLLWRGLGLLGDAAERGESGATGGRVDGEGREANMLPATWKLLPAGPAGTLLGGRGEGCPALPPAYLEAAGRGSPAPGAFLSGGDRGHSFTNEAPRRGAGSPGNPTSLGSAVPHLPHSASLAPALPSWGPGLAQS